MPTCARCSNFTHELRQTTEGGWCGGCVDIVAHQIELQLSQEAEAELPVDLEGEDDDAPAS